MSTRIIRKTGFSVVELVIIVVVVGVIGLLGYVAYNSFQNKNAESSKQATASDVQAVPTINSTDDLQKAEQTLDQTNLDSSDDVKQLDSDLAAF